MIMSHSSMLIAQSGPMSISLVALSAHDAAPPAIPDVPKKLHSSPQSSKNPNITSQSTNSTSTVVNFENKLKMNPINAEKN